MRCGCPQCGTWMIHEEGGSHLDCCCPDCGFRCNACLGTDSVMSREDIAAYKAGHFVKRLSEAEDLLLDQEEETGRQEQENLWPWISQEN